MSNECVRFRLKEQLIKSVYASTKDLKETNEQYEQHIKVLQKVSRYCMNKLHISFLRHELLFRKLTKQNMNIKIYRRQFSNWQPKRRVRNRN
jgi:D-ribose pyranose/furanose isomerase RbsD